MFTSYILLKPFNNKIFYRNNIFNIDNGHNVFFGLKNKLSKKNILIDTLDRKKDIPVSLYIYCDVPYPWEIKLWIDLIMHSKKNILLVFESPIVNPFNHLSILKYFFKKIFTWDGTKVDNIKYFKFFIPQISPKTNLSILSYEKKKNITAILSNKTSLILFKLISPYKTSLYNKRVSLFKYLDDSREFWLYGNGWNRAARFSFVERILGFYKFKSYVGEVKQPDKYNVIRKYRYYIAFENTVAPGYITEKIFDALKSHVVPIYYGAKNISEFIPLKSFVDASKFKNNESLIKFIKNVNKIEYNNMVKVGSNFLKSEIKKGKWFEQGFYDLLLKEVQLN